LLYYCTVLFFLFPLSHLNTNALCYFFSSTGFNFQIHFSSIAGTSLHQI
jgi:hypothetical protein